MSKFFKRPNNLSIKDLENHDWDLIELPIILDPVSWHLWYNHIKKYLNDCSFSLKDDKTLLGNELSRGLIYENIHRSIWGDPKQWMLQWGIQREGVIPPSAFANPDVFLEMREDFNPSKVNLSQYMFGAYEKFHNAFDNHSFAVCKLLEYAPGEGLKPHVDVVGGFMPRILIHIKNNDASVHFSDDPPSLLTEEYYYIEPTSSRQHKLEEGKVYLLNTAVTHYIKNDTNQTTALIQMDPSDSILDRLLTIEELYIC